MTILTVKLGFIEEKGIRLADIWKQIESEQDEQIAKCY